MKTNMLRVISDMFGSGVDHCLRRGVVRGVLDKHLRWQWIDGHLLVPVGITSDSGSVFLMRGLRQRTEVIGPSFI